MTLESTIMCLNTPWESHGGFNNHLSLFRVNQVVLFQFQSKAPKKYVSIHILY